jgi:DNA-binding NarL/FixJ family response regulator
MTRTFHTYRINSSIFKNLFLNVGVQRRQQMRTFSELTTQERRVLALVATGRRNARIAQELFISTRTVENHLYRIFDKLGVSSRTEAALHALTNGLLNLEMSGNAHDSLDNPHYSGDIG